MTASYPDSSERIGWCRHDWSLGWCLIPNCKGFWRRWSKTPTEMTTELPEADDA